MQVPHAYGYVIPGRHRASVVRLQGRCTTLVLVVAVALCFVAFVLSDAAASDASSPAPQEKHTLPPPPENMKGNRGSGRGKGKVRRKPVRGARKFAAIPKRAIAHSKHLPTNKFTQRTAIQVHICRRIPMTFVPFYLCLPSFLFPPFFLFTPCPSLSFPSVPRRRPLSRSPTPCSAWTPP